ILYPQDAGGEPNGSVAPKISWAGSIRHVLRLAFQGSLNGAVHLLSLWKQMLEAFRQILGAWRQRARDRHALAQLDDRSIRDLGLTPTQIAYALQAPWWRPVQLGAPHRK